MYDILQLNEMLVPELREIAEKLDVKSYKKLTKQDLIYKILDHQAISGEALSPKSKTSKPAKEEKTPRKRKRKAVVEEGKGSGDTPKKKTPLKEDVRPIKKERVLETVEASAKEEKKVKSMDDSKAKKYSDREEKAEKPEREKRKFSSDRDRKDKQDDSEKVHFNIDFDGVIEGDGVLNQTFRTPYRRHRTGRDSSTERR